MNKNIATPEEMAARVKKMEQQREEHRWTMAKYGIGMLTMTLFSAFFSRKANREASKATVVVIRDPRS